MVCVERCRSPWWEAERKTLKETSRIRHELEKEKKARGPSTHSFIHSFIHSFDLFIHSFVRSFIHSFDSFIRFIHSFDTLLYFDSRPITFVYFDSRPITFVYFDGRPITFVCRLSMYIIITMYYSLDVSGAQLRCTHMVSLFHSQGQRLAI